MDFGNCRGTPRGWVVDHSGRCAAESIWAQSTKARGLMYCGWRSSLSNVPQVHALLLRLSAFLLQRETDHLSGVDTADLTPRFHPATALEGPCCELRSHALKSHIARLSARFVEHAQGAVRVQQSWRVYSVQLAQGWRQTAKTRRVVEGRVAELKAAGCVLLLCVSTTLIHLLSSFFPTDTAESHIKNKTRELLGCVRRGPNSMTSAQSLVPI